MSASKFLAALRGASQEEQQEFFGPETDRLRIPRLTEEDLLEKARLAYLEGVAEGLRSEEVRRQHGKERVEAIRREGEADLRATAAEFTPAADSIRNDPLAKMLGITGETIDEYRAVLTEANIREGRATTGHPIVSVAETFEQGVRGVVDTAVAATDFSRLDEALGGVDPQQYAQTLGMGLGGAPVTNAQREAVEENAVPAVETDARVEMAREVRTPQQAAEAEARDAEVDQARDPTIAGQLASGGLDFLRGVGGAVAGSQVTVESQLLFEGDLATVNRAMKFGMVPEDIREKVRAMTPAERGAYARTLGPVGMISSYLGGWRRIGGEMGTGLARAGLGATAMTARAVEAATFGLGKHGFIDPAQAREWLLERSHDLGYSIEHSDEGQVAAITGDGDNDVANGVRLVQATVDVVTAVGPGLRAGKFGLLSDAKALNATDELAKAARAADDAADAEDALKAKHMLDSYAEAVEAEAKKLIDEATPGEPLGPSGPAPDVPGDAGPGGVTFPAADEADAAFPLGPPAFDDLGEDMRTLAAILEDSDGSFVTRGGVRIAAGDVEHITQRALAAMPTEDQARILKLREDIRKRSADIVKEQEHLKTLSDKDAARRTARRRLTDLVRKGAGSEPIEDTLEREAKMEALKQDLETRLSPEESRFLDELTDADGNEIAESLRADFANRGAGVRDETLEQLEAGAPGFTSAVRGLSGRVYRARPHEHHADLLRRIEDVSEDFKLDDAGDAVLSPSQHGWINEATGEFISAKQADAPRTLEAAADRLLPAVIAREAEKLALRRAQEGAMRLDVAAQLRRIEKAMRSLDKSVAEFTEGKAFTDLTPEQQALVEPILREAADAAAEISGAVEPITHAGAFDRAVAAHLGVAADGAPAAYHLTGQLGDIPYEQVKATDGLTRESLEAQLKQVLQREREGLRETLEGQRGELQTQVDELERRRIPATDEEAAAERFWIDDGKGAATLVEDRRDLASIKPGKGKRWDILGPDGQRLTSRASREEAVSAAERLGDKATPEGKALAQARRDAKQQARQRNSAVVLDLLQGRVDQASRDAQAALGAKIKSIGAPSPEVAETALTTKLIAKRTGLSSRDVGAAMQELHKRGLVRKKPASPVSYPAIPGQTAKRPKGFRRGAAGVNDRGVRWEAIQSKAEAAEESPLVASKFDHGRAAPGSKWATDPEAKPPSTVDEALEYSAGEGDAFLREAEAPKKAAPAERISVAYTNAQAAEIEETLSSALQNPDDLGGIVLGKKIEGGPEDLRRLAQALESNYDSVGGMSEVHPSRARSMRKLAAKLRKAADEAPKPAEAAAVAPKALTADAIRAKVNAATVRLGHLIESGTLPPAAAREASNRLRAAGHLALQGDVKAPAALTAEDLARGERLVQEEITRTGLTGERATFFQGYRPDNLQRAILDEGGLRNVSGGEFENIRALRPGLAAPKGRGVGADELAESLGFEGDVSAFLEALETEIRRGVTATSLKWDDLSTAEIDFWHRQSASGKESFDSPEQVRDSFDRMVRERIASRPEILEEGARREAQELAAGEAAAARLAQMPSEAKDLYQFLNEHIAGWLRVIDERAHRWAQQTGLHPNQYISEWIAGVSGKAEEFINALRQEGGPLVTIDLPDADAAMFAGAADDLARVAPSATLDGNILTFRAKDMRAVAAISGRVDSFVSRGLSVWSQALPPDAFLQASTKRLGDAALVPASRVADLLTDFPEHLFEVQSFLIKQRGRFLNGEMTRRDLAKALVMTSASQNAGAIGVDVLKAKLHKRGIKLAIPDEYTSVSKAGSLQVRPEEAVAAWLSGKRGKRALDQLEKGRFNQVLWDELREVRKAYGNDQLGPLMRPSKGKTSLTDLSEFDEMLKAGDADLLQRSVNSRFATIGNIKGAFLKHLLGFGNSSTIDARQIRTWLLGPDFATGKLPAGDVAATRKKIDAIKKAISAGTAEGAQLRARIQRSIKSLSGMLPEGILEADSAHILHHWIWDAVAETQTRHRGMMSAMMFAQGGGKGKVVRGAIKFMEDGRAMLGFFDWANPSTLVHELGHLWRYDLAKVARVNPQAAFDLAEAERILGVKGGRWTRDAEEKWARAVERWFERAEAPTKGMRETMERFGEWIRGHVDSREAAGDRQLSRIFDNFFLPSPIPEVARRRAATTPMNRLFGSVLTSFADDPKRLGYLAGAMAALAQAAVPNQESEGPQPAQAGMGAPLVAMLLASFLGKRGRLDKMGKLAAKAMGVQGAYNARELIRRFGAHDINGVIDGLRNQAPEAFAKMPDPHIRIIAQSIMEEAGYTNSGVDVLGITARDGHSVFTAQDWAKTQNANPPPGGNANQTIWEKAVDNAVNQHIEANYVEATRGNPAHVGGPTGNLPPPGTVGAGDQVSVPWDLQKGLVDPVDLPGRSAVAGWFDRGTRKLLESVAREGGVLYMLNALVLPVSGAIAVGASAIGNILVQQLRLGSKASHLGTLFMRAGSTDPKIYAAVKSWGERIGARVPDQGIRGMDDIKAMVVEAEKADGVTAGTYTNGMMPLHLDDPPDGFRLQDKYTLQQAQTFKANPLIQEATAAWKRLTVEEAYMTGLINQGQKQSAIAGHDVDGMVAQYWRRFSDDEEKVRVLATILEDTQKARFAGPVVSEKMLMDELGLSQGAITRYINSGRLKVAGGDKGGRVFSVEAAEQLRAQRVASLRREIVDTAAGGGKSTWEDYRTPDSIFYAAHKKRKGDGRFILRDWDQMMHRYSGQAGRKWGMDPVMPAVQAIRTVIKDAKVNHRRLLSFDGKSAFYPDEKHLDLIKKFVMNAEGKLDHREFANEKLTQFLRDTFKGEELVDQAHPLWIKANQFFRAMAYTSLLELNPAFGAAQIMQRIVSAGAYIGTRRVLHAEKTLRRLQAGGKTPDTKMFQEVVDGMGFKLSNQNVHTGDLDAYSPLVGKSPIKIASWTEDGNKAVTGYARARQYEDLSRFIVWEAMGRPGRWRDVDLTDKKLLEAFAKKAGDLEELQEAVVFRLLEGPRKRNQLLSDLFVQDRSALKTPTHQIRSAVKTLREAGETGHTGLVRRAAIAEADEAATVAMLPFGKTEANLLLAQYKNSRPGLLTVVQFKSFFAKQMNFFWRHLTFKGKVKFMATSLALSGPRALPGISFLAGANAAFDKFFSDLERSSSEEAGFLKWLLTRNLRSFLGIGMTSQMSPFGRFVPGLQRTFTGSEGEGLQTVERTIKDFGGPAAGMIAGTVLPMAEQAAHGGNPMTKAGSAMSSVLPVAKAVRHEMEGRPQVGQDPETLAQWVRDLADPDSDNGFRIRAALGFNPAGREDRTLLHRFIRSQVKSHRVGHDAVMDALIYDGEAIPKFIARTGLDWTEVQSSISNRGRDHRERAVASAPITPKFAGAFMELIQDADKEAELGDSRLGEKTSEFVITKLRKMQHRARDERTAEMARTLAEEAETIARKRGWPVPRVKRRPNRPSLTYKRFERALLELPDGLDKRAIFEHFRKRVPRKDRNKVLGIVDAYMKTSLSGALGIGDSPTIYRLRDNTRAFRAEQGE